MLNKTTMSAFPSTNLEEVLQTLNVSYLVFTGVSTNFCVEATARNAVDYGYRSVMVEDASSAYNEGVAGQRYRHVATVLRSGHPYRETNRRNGECVGSCCRYVEWAAEFVRSCPLHKEKYSLTTRKGTFQFDSRKIACAIRLRLGALFGGVQHSQAKIRRQNHGQQTTDQTLPFHHQSH